MESCVWNDDAWLENAETSIAVNHHEGGHYAVEEIDENGNLKAYAKAYVEFDDDEGHEAFVKFFPRGQLMTLRRSVIEAAILDHFERRVQ
jgi:hypothetical protein